MRIPLASLVLAASILGGCASVPRPSYEAQLAERLRGRVAGEPVRCIDLQRVQSVGVIERTALVYEVGSVLYVNRPASADNLRALDTLSTRTFAGQLCRGDPVDLLDASARFPRSFVILGDFIPYRRS